MVTNGKKWTKTYNMEGIKKDTLKFNKNWGYERKMDLIGELFFFFSKICDLVAVEEFLFFKLCILCITMHDFVSCFVRLS